MTITCISVFSGRPIKYEAIPILLCVFLFSCKKQNTVEKEPAFYVSYKILDSTYIYKTGDNYTYVNWASSSTSLGSDAITTYIPHTGIIPLPYDYNKQKIGFAFYGAVRACITCDQEAKMAELGNQIFRTGNYEVGFTGLNFNTLPYDIYYPQGVAVAWLSDNEKYFASTSEVQPQGSYFTIDSIINKSYTRPNSNLYDYEKIIIGRFQCRVYFPENKALYKDLKEGRFMMPIWRKKS